MVACCNYQNFMIENKEFFLLSNWRYLTQIRWSFFIIRLFEMQIRFVGATNGRPLQLPEFHADNQ